MSAQHGDCDALHMLQIYFPHLQTSVQLRAAALNLPFISSALTISSKWFG